MDIDEIRRINIRALEAELGAPTLAKRAEMSLSQFYNLRDGAKDSKTGKRRGMRKMTAWKIEEAAGKPRGYLDVLHDETNITAAPQRRPIPVISWVQAGEFSDIVDLHEAGLTSEWFDGYIAKLSDQAFALVVQGDSMVSPYPGTHSFPPGTRIIVDPLQVPAAGEFCLAKDVAAQTATFKKLHHEDGRWYLKPLNPVFPMVEIDDPSLRVLGKVVESYLQVRL